MPSEVYYTVHAGDDMAKHGCHLLTPGEGADTFTIHKDSK